MKRYHWLTPAISAFAAGTLVWFLKGSAPDDRTIGDEIVVRDAPDPVDGGLRGDPDRASDREIEQLADALADAESRIRNLTTALAQAESALIALRSVAVIGVTISHRGGYAGELATSELVFFRSGDTGVVPSYDTPYRPE